MTTTACECCSRIRDGRTPGRATWRWWTHEGRYFNDLCESCTGWWLIGCLEDGTMFVRLELVPGVVFAAGP